MAKPFSVFAAGVGCLLLLASTPGQGTVIFQGIGDLPGGSFDSRALGISGDGSVVVGWSQSASGRQGFRWTLSGGMVGLEPVQGGTGSIATAANYDGSVIVGRVSIADAQDPFRHEAFRWTEAGGMVSIGDLPGGVTRGIANDVSADGSVIVGNGTELSTAGVSAFIWTESTGIQQIVEPPGTGAGTAAGVSADGRIAVGKVSASPNGISAVRWTAETGMVLLGDLPNDTPPVGTIAHGISADGSTIVGLSSGNGPFAWTEENGFLFLGNADGTTGTALAATADGAIIVGMTSLNEATIWDAEHGNRLLEQVLTEDYGIDLGGWRLTSATAAISDDGRFIIGTGINPSGATEGWIFINPEPSTGSLLALGLVGLGVRRRSRRLAGRGASGNKALRIH